MMRIPALRRDAVQRASREAARLVMTDMDATRRVAAQRAFGDTHPTVNLSRAHDAARPRCSRAASRCSRRVIGSGSGVSCSDVITSRASAARTMRAARASITGSSTARCAAFI
jgi:hypothetical protein